MPDLVKGYFSKRDDKGRVISCVAQELYKGDLAAAVEQFPHEWSHKPLKVDGAEPEVVVLEKAVKPPKRRKTGGRKRKTPPAPVPQSDDGPAPTAAPADGEGEQSA